MGVSRLRAWTAGSNRRIRSLWLAALTVCSLMALPAAAAQADAQWTGASSGAQWSAASNWSGTPPAPNSSAGTLTFPTLGSCNTCYTSQNDLSGVSATGLVLGNDTNQYMIQGTSFTVGTDGVSDAPGGGAGDVISAPVALTGGSQTWILGSSTNGYNSLTFLGGIMGSGTAVTTSIPRGDLFIDSDMEVGPVVSNGPGGFHIGGKPGSGNPGSVNASDGQPFTVNGGTLIPNPSSTTGPLTVNSATLLLGTFTTNTHATTLQVNGSASLATSTTTQTFINANGSTPGTDFSQLSASGNIAIGGQLTIGHGPNNSGNCVALSPGDVATLVSAPGGLSGTFSNASDGAVVNLAPSPCTGGATQVQISYTSNSVTATALGATTPTTTTLAPPSPSPASTNQPVTLTATVSTSSVAPSGTVTFSANGAAIPGCSSQPVTGSGSSGTATCTTSFAASGSPESLTAAFTPSNGSGQTGSSSSAQNLTVDQGTTATTLAASSTNPVAGGTVTYTATASPGIAGPSEPSGTVAFLDGGSAISGCSARPLAAGASSTATCTVSYPGAGSHAIVAIYGGDANFTGSTSGATKVAVSAGGGGRAPGISATTSRATGVGTTQATLNGSMLTGGAAVRWKLQYGRTTAYGQTTATHTIAAGQQKAVKVSLVVKGLSPNSRYHYRLVVSTGGQTADGKDATFSTKATGQVTGARVQLVVTGRTILLVERCRSSVICRGRITLTRTVRTGKHGKLRTERCASTSVRIRAHRTATISITLSAACVRFLLAQPHHRLLVLYTFQSQTGQVGERERVMLVLQPPRGAARPSSG